MADSIRQKIVDAMVERFKLINGTGVYTTDVENRVADSETNWAEDQDQLPAISVFDGDSEPNLQARGAQTPGVIHVMTVYVRGFVKQGATAKNARDLLKDIIRAAGVDTEWTVSNVKLAMKSEPGTERIVRNADNFQVEGCEFQIGVFFLTQFFNAEA